MILHFALAVAAAVATSPMDNNRNLPESPVPKVVAVHRQDHPRRLWLAETLVLAGVAATDLTVTARGLGEPCGPGCGRMVETNPIMGRHPGNGRLVAIGGAIFVGESLLLRQTERSRHGWIRWAGRVGFGYAVLGHAQGIRSWQR